MRIWPSGLSARNSSTSYALSGQAVGGGELRVELARERRVGAQEAAPRAQLELVQPCSASCG